MKLGRQHPIRKGTVMTGTTALIPGISAAEQHCLEQGAREFFGRQGTDVLAEFVRREGGNALSGGFAALTEPAVSPGHSQRTGCTTHDGKHWYY